MFDVQDLYPLLLLAMVQLALIGGIGAAIVKVISRQRAVEALYRERIADCLRSASHDPRDASPSM